MKKRPDPEKREQALANIRRDQELRAQSYRGQALKILPHVCGRCGREFSGKRLSELTVHHKDGNHMNNPPDGSNWELLCLYCHDDQHETRASDGYYEGAGLAYSDQRAIGFPAVREPQKPAETQRRQRDALMRAGGTPAPQ